MSRLKSMTQILLIVTTLSVLIFAGIVFAQLPSEIVSHFNLYGEPDGFADKRIVYLLFGLLLVGLPFAFTFLKGLDPKWDNYAKFKKAYHIMIFAIQLFLQGIFLMLILVNLGIDINIQMVVLIMIGILFMVMGNFFGKLKQNFFIGLRTPWTLNDDEIWYKTHRRSGPIWVIGGVFTIFIGFLPPTWAITIFLLTITTMIIFPIVYSAQLSRKK